MFNFLFLLFWLIFYIYFQVSGIYGGDAGDFVSSAIVNGIPHPPGFPLYALIAHLLTKIGIGTFAFRVAFLSSIPTAFALFFLFLFLKSYFKERLVPFLCVLILGFSYPVWLFAITVEVYSLNLFFTSLTFYLLYRAYLSKKIIYLYAFYLSLGLAISHHQLTLFLLPGYFYFIYVNRKRLSLFNIKNIFKAFVLIVIGFTPYIYTFVTAQNLPLISWGNPSNLNNLINLVLKKQYGYVYSGPVISENIQERLLSLPVYKDFIINDFTVLGVVLAITGFFYFLKTSRKFFYYLLLLFGFSGPLLYFYAAFTLDDAFRVAIFEQFLSFSYFFFAIYIAAGIFGLRSLILLIIAKVSQRLRQRKYIVSFVNLLFIPSTFVLFFVNYPKLSILKNDFTGDNLGLDVLKTTEADSILFLASDTILFDSQYIYFSQNPTPGVKLFHYEKFLSGEYYKLIDKHFKELDLYSNNLAGYEALYDFISKNYSKYPIYTNIIFDHGLKENGQWVRMGILYRLYKKEDLPTVSQIIEENDRLWSIYQDPKQGSLKNFENLFLTNVLFPYGISHHEYARFLLNTENYSKALEHIQKSYDLMDDPQNYYLENEILVKLSKCDQALEILDKNPTVKIQWSSKYYFSVAATYEQCFKDDKKAKEFFNKAEEERKKEETPIEELE